MRVTKKIEERFQTSKVRDKWAEMEAGNVMTAYIQHWESKSNNICNYTLRKYCRKIRRSKSIHNSSKGSFLKKIA